MSGTTDGKFFSIAQAGGMTDVPAHILRYWEREFSYLKPLRDQKGRRIYTAGDIEKIRQIRKLVYLDGFRIQGAKKKLREKKRERKASVAETAAFLRQVVKEIEGITKCLQ
jgi:DNA-binding transcriptional MerR regulator